MIFFMIDCGTGWGLGGGGVASAAWGNLEEPGGGEI